MSVRKRLFLSHIAMIVMPVIIIILIICGKWIFDKNRDDKIKNSLQNILNTSLSKDEKVSFRFDTLANFDWDEMIICPPYFNAQRFQDRKHVDFTEVEKTGILSSDHFSVIAFLKNREIVNVVKISPFISFSGFEGGNFISRSKIFQAAPMPADKKTHVIVKLIN